MGAHDGAEWRGLSWEERLGFALWVGWTVGEQGLHCPECDNWLSTVGELRLKDYEIPTMCFECKADRPEGKIGEKETEEMTQYSVEGRGTNGCVLTRIGKDGNKEILGRFANKKEAMKAQRQLEAGGEGATFDKRRLAE